MTLYERLIPFPHPLLITFLDRARFQEKFEMKGEKECWPWLGCLVSGYGHFKLLGEYYISSRVAWFFHYRQDPGKLLVLHDCNNRKCCNPTHLSLGKGSDNNVHKFATNQDWNGGEANPFSILNEEQVLEIRASNLTTQTLANKYGVHYSCIYKIRRRESWKHLS
jgi:hypothetical protein